MKTYFKAILILLLAATSLNAYGQKDKFVGKWFLKTIISDSAKVFAKSVPRDMEFEKVTKGYYRAVRGQNTLLYQQINDSTLFSNVAADREVTVTWKSKDLVKISMLLKYTDKPSVPPTVMIWEREKLDKKKKK